MKILPRRVAWSLLLVLLVATFVALQYRSTASAQIPAAVLRVPTSTTFTRWGNATPPGGTKLIYSGFAYASHYAHAGASEPIVVQSGDPGSLTSLGNLLYPLQTGSTTLPPGIVPQREIVAAVCEAPHLTTTIWGTHTAPSGWTVLYRGYAMGAYYNHEGPVGPLCIDTDAFDASHSGGSNAALLYPSQLETPALGSGDLGQRFVKCAVIMKL